MEVSLLILCEAGSCRLIRLCGAVQILKPRAGFITVHEALRHIQSIKPEVDLIKEAHDTRSERLYAIRGGGENVEAGAFEKEYSAKENNIDLYNILTEVSLLLFLRSHGSER